MLLDDLDCARMLVERDRLAPDHHVEIVHRLVMRAHIVEALGRVRMVVEGDAGADHVDEGRAPMLDRRLDQGHELLLVAREGAGDEGRPEQDRDRDEVDRRVLVEHALLRGRALVGGSRELALGEAVDPVVLADIGHVHAAADAMGELAEADRGGVAVARDAEIDKVAIGEARAGQHRGHAPVDAVEAVARAEEIGRRLRRAADAGELRHPVRGERQFETGLDDGPRDRIVPAAGAERRDRTLVVAMGEAEFVGRELRVMEARLGDVGHGSPVMSAGTLPSPPQAGEGGCGPTHSAASRLPPPVASTWWAIASTMKRAVIGVPS